MPNSTPALRRLSILAATALIATLGACSVNTQMTSGADYLARYDNNSKSAQITNIDNEVRAIASVEPDLRFPARIGIARIERGKLTSLPQDEALIWQDMATELGEGYGDFIPVSPLIAAMVSQDDSEIGHYDPARIVNNIRRGAARQHLDYVMIYEIGQKSNRESNALRAADLTILGLYLLPSRNVEVEATASALLLDVRNGYPYATASNFAEKSALTTYAGADKRKGDLGEAARLLAVKRLSGDTQTALEELKSKLPAQMVTSASLTAP